MKLYELAAAERDRLFSPYCWRVRLALAHKGLEAETVPWRFTEKEAIGKTGQGRVPVLVDGDTWVNDSWAIACYLEDRHPDRPSIFGGGAGRALSRFYSHWADSVLQPAIMRFVLLDIYRHIDERDRPYFRQSREERFGMPIEDFVGERDQRLPGFRDLLQPLRLTVQGQPFLGGAAPLYADYAVYGAFQFARTISPYTLLAADDPVEAWRRRVMQLHGGIAAKAKAYPW